MPLSGKEMLSRYRKAGWSFDHQTGSHVIVKKGNSTEVIPMHPELHKGMERYLLKRLGKGETP
jgi:predicted RNA binding protein YcfA (HicA-like mRNA interferase family)